MRIVTVAYATIAKYGVGHMIFQGNFIISGVLLLTILPDTGSHQPPR